MIKWGLLKNHIHFLSGMHLVPGGIPDAGMQVNIRQVTVARISANLVSQRTIRTDALVFIELTKKWSNFIIIRISEKSKLRASYPYRKKIQLNCLIRSEHANLRILLRRL